MKTHSACVLITLFSSIWANADEMPTNNRSAHSPREVVFVCEHGAALSVVSAAFFNKFAKEQHLDMHARARGIIPTENLASSASHGLKADGVPSEVQKPQVLSQDDLLHADYVVTFAPLPAKYSTSAPVETWNDVPTDAGYDKWRDAILVHMRRLLEKLETHQ